MKKQNKNDKIDLSLLDEAYQAKKKFLDRSKPFFARSIIAVVIVVIAVITDAAFSYQRYTTVLRETPLMLFMATATCTTMLNVSQAFGAIFLKETLSKTDAMTALERKKSLAFFIICEVVFLLAFIPSAILSYTTAQIGFLDSQGVDALTSLSNTAAEVTTNATGLESASSKAFAFFSMGATLGSSVLSFLSSYAAYDIENLAAKAAFDKETLVAKIKINAQLDELNTFDAEELDAYDLEALQHAKAENEKIRQTRKIEARNQLQQHLQLEAEDIEYVTSESQDILNQ